MKFQATENFYKLLFNNANDGILLANLETKKFYLANKAICKMLGYSYKEIKHLKVEDIHPEEDLPYVLAQFEKQARGKAGESISAEDMPVKRKDGSIFYATIGASRIKLAGRRYLMGVFRNTTDRRQILQNLEDAKIAARNVYEDLQAEKERIARDKAKDEALLESIGEGVVAVDSDDKVILMNKTAEDLLGFTSQEIRGKSFVQMIPLLDTAGNQILMAQRPIILTLNLGKTIAATTDYFVRKNGTKFPVAITATPVLLGAKIIGGIIVFRDITREKAIEKLRLDFLSLASHQLRTPLSGTKWLIETIQRGTIGELNPKQKEYFNNIYQINERMIRLVSDMLNVLTLESSVMVIKKQEIPVAKLFRELFLMMGPASRNKGIILRQARKDYESFFLEADLQILRNILECFVSNAISYSQKGQAVILDAKAEPAAIVFSIEDSGIGIPKEEQKMIFERFYRASNAKEFKTDGTGLGLYTASLLAQKIGGKIFFESQKNKGSIFYLRVPKDRVGAEKSDRGEKREIIK